MTRQGRFVTLEGGEGVGKSTQLASLAERLRGDGREVVATREPGGTEAAERMRALLLDPSLGLSASAEVHLHFAARADHLDRLVRPALDRGAIVLCDRFTDSTLAYQHYGAGASRALIETLCRLMPVRPDLTLILHADEAVRAERVARRRAVADRYEARSEAFHRRVNEGFVAIARADPQRCALIDANGSLDEVARSIAATLAVRIGI